MERCLSWRNEEESRLDYLDASRAKGITMVAPEIDSLERGQTVDSVMRQWAKHDPRFPRFSHALHRLPDRDSAHDQRSLRGTRCRSERVS